MPEKEYTITNCTITKVTPGPAGERGGKPWQILRLEVDHAKASGKEFTKFVNPEEPENHPYVGAPIQKMTFTVKQSGDFTNYTVRKILYRQGEEREEEAAPPATLIGPPIAEPTTEQIPDIPKAISICVSYAKDLMCAIISSKPTKLTENDLPGIVDQVARQGVLMYRDLVRYQQYEEDVPREN